MAGFITYWPKEHIGKLKKEKDNGPISVIFGSVHTKMPSIKSVKEGDVIYPVTVSSGTLCVLARLPVEKIEPAYEYLIREVGSLCGALVPEEKDWNWREFYKNAPMKPHKYHQRPFNCCSETAAVSAHGSSIELRPIPKEKLPQLMFGPTKAKQKAMMLDKDGSPKVISISSSVRKMSEETQKIFETLFQENDSESKRENEIRQAIIRILEVYNIRDGRDFETMDEDTGCVLYENLKAGVLEKFNLCDEKMDEYLNEVLGFSTETQ